MGARLRARLPEGNGLTAEVASDYAENPRQVVVIAVLDVDAVTQHVHEEDSTTTHFELISLEPFEGAAGDDLRTLLRQRFEARTGEAALFDLSETPGSSTGDPEELTRQLDLLRLERAAELREKAETSDDKDEADQLGAIADAYESGFRDEELRAALAPQFLAADDSPDGDETAVA